MSVSDRIENRLWTIGHGNLDLEVFIELLQANLITLIVDVRSSPYSRFVPDFNREPLQRSLKRQGITYRFEGDRLGGRPADPDCYKQGVIPTTAGRHDYLKLVDYERVQEREWFQNALKEMLELAKSQRVALLCSEENPADCHRERLISQSINRIHPDYSVFHIRRDGSVSESNLQAVQRSLM